MFEFLSIHLGVFKFVVDACRVEGNEEGIPQCSIELVLFYVQVGPVVRLVGMSPQRAHGVVFVRDRLGVELRRGQCGVMVVDVGNVVALRQQDTAGAADAAERGLTFRFTRL